MELVLHTLSEEQIKGFLHEPTHAVLLTGPVGSGKGAIAVYLSTKLLNLSSEKLTHYPYFQHIIPGTSISIETIRTLQEFTRLRTPGKNRIRRVIVLENANTMTHEAQNAFLKLLEEPPDDTVIIMTAAHTSGLLPTVISRAQRIHVHAPTAMQIASHLKHQGYTDDEIRRMQYISDGQIGLMTALLDAEYHPLIEGIESAKQLLIQGAYDRLKQIDILSKQKDYIYTVLEGLERLSAAGLKQAIDREKNTDAQRWQKTLKLVLSAKQSLILNAQPKLLLTDLLLNI